MEKDNSIVKDFSTTKIGLAVYLRANGFRYDIERMGNGNGSTEYQDIKLSIHFKDIPQVLINTYICGEALMEVENVVHTHRHLSKDLYRAKRYYATNIKYGTMR